MRFKEFLQNEELHGLYGPVGKAGGEKNIFKLMIKDVKPPFGMGRGDAIRNMMKAGPKATKPARPAGPGLGPNRPMTVPSVLKSIS